MKYLLFDRIYNLQTAIAEGKKTKTELWNKLMDRRGTEKLKKSMYNQRLSASQIRQEKHRFEKSSILLLVFWAAITCGVVYGIIRFTKPTPLVTYLEYSQIAAKMDYTEVRDIIGSGGVKVSSDIYELFKTTFFGDLSESQDKSSGNVIKRMMNGKNRAKLALQEAVSKTSSDNTSTEKPVADSDEELTTLFSCVNQDGSGLLIALDKDMRVMHKSTRDVLETPDVFSLEGQQG